MKVLLISTNQLGPSGACDWMPVEPLGLAYVAASTRRAGHEVSLLDLCFSSEPVAAVGDAVERFDPDVIGVSFRNVEMMAYFRNTEFREDLRSIIAECRVHSGAPVVLGGSGFSLMPDHLMRFTGADIGVVGEGEWNFPAVLAALEGEGDVTGIPGTVRIEDGRMELVPPDHAGDLSTLPLPARELIDHDHYAASGGSANIQTKRGCPFNCIYCTYPLVEGSRMRCRPPADVAAEIRLLRERYGAQDVYVVDNQFNHPLDHAKAVCTELLEMRDEVKIWWTCMLNPGFIDDDLVFLLRASRCALVDFGIESADEEVLRALGKSHTREDISRAVGLFDKYGLHYNSWVLFGGPGESEETVRGTVEFLDRIDVPRVLFSIGIRVCPGTAIERLMRDNGSIAAADDLHEPVFHCTPDAETIASIVQPYCAGREGWQIAAFRRLGGEGGGASGAGGAGDG